MLRLLALEIPSSFLWNQQIVFISAFNHFFPPNSNVLSFPSLDSSVYMSTPLSLFSLIAFSSSLLREGRRKDEGGRWRKGLKMQIKVCSSFLWQIRPHYTHLSFAIGSGQSLCLACLHYIKKPFTSCKPSSAAGPVKRREQTPRWPKRDLWLQGTRFVLQTKWDRAGEVGGHHLYVCGQTVQYFFALAPCQQPTPLSLSASWELLPPSRSDRGRLETKEEKYKHPLELLSLLKQDIL